MENKKYKCAKCGYTYDPEVGDPKHGIEPGTPFEALPEDWKCPRCRKPKDQFCRKRRKEGANLYGRENRYFGNDEKGW